MLGRRIVTVVGCIVALVGLVYAVRFAMWFADAARPPQPPLPPLLQDATATGGGGSDCDEPENVRTQPQSPQIATRLLKVAPPGSPAIRLEHLLKQQGFTDEKSCATMPSLHNVMFMQEPGGGLSDAALAVIWWKVDPPGRIQWTSGNIEYSGL
jgi:hypothetical protein